jgi:hypothetical protein
MFSAGIPVQTKKGLNWKMMPAPSRPHCLIATIRSFARGDDECGQIRMNPVVSIGITS